MSNPGILDALRRVALNHPAKLLLPEEVVAAAKDEASPLHKLFSWDDAAAAHQYRIFQARNLIRTTVQFLKVDGEQKQVRAFVSLTTDRANDGGGYRELVAVLANRTTREQLLVDALSELESFQRKYAELRELSDVFSAIRRVSRNLTEVKKAA